jgi:hypothetical protein
MFDVHFLVKPLYETGTVYYKNVVFFLIKLAIFQAGGWAEP